MPGLRSCRRSPSGESEALVVKGRIEAGEISFADAAREYSGCPSSAKGGDLGTFKKGAMVPEFDAVVFDESVPFGRVDVCKTQFGTHLITVVERSSKE